MVDINADGWLDIYVCKSGKPDSSDHRRNELFINSGQLDSEGRPVFRESAHAYGIDDLGFSIHAVFFDYDKDDDLDMYLSNNSIKSTDVIHDASKGLREVRDEYGGNKLYKNVGEKFVDASEEAGIYGSAIGYGLGVSVGDVNRDGWTDIYVANDFFEKDYLYINNGDGTFTESLEKYLAEISLGSMGVEIGDINNDGFPEIFVTEMLPDSEARLKTSALFDTYDQYYLKIKNGYYRQFPRNIFQLNNGFQPDGNDVFFSEISRFSGMDATDWSWGVQFADFNNDGKKEIFITNGIVKDLFDRDHIDFYQDPSMVRNILKEKGKVIEEIIDNMPSVPVANYMYAQTRNLIFEDFSSRWGIDQPGFSTGSAYGDLDNDGDIDLVVSNNNQKPFLYRNETEIDSTHHFINVTLIGKGKNKDALGSQVTVWSAGQLYYMELFPTRGSLSSVDKRLHFGLGAVNKIDSVEIIWPDGTQSVIENPEINSFITIRQPDSINSLSHSSSHQNHTWIQKRTDLNNLKFLHQESDFIDFDKEKLLLHSMSDAGPKMDVADLNGDGLDDLFIGGAKGFSATLYLSDNTGRLTVSQKELFAADRLSEDTDVLFFDADGDNDLDLMVTSGGLEFSSSAFALADRLYINDGSGHLTRSQQVFPAGNLESSSCVTAADFDGDGDQDLFVGIRLKPELYGIPASSYLLQNTGNGEFIDVTKELLPDLIDIGMVTDAQWVDFDGDLDEDLVVLGDWMPIRAFRNDNERFVDVSEEVGFTRTSGFWNVLEKADLDGDGDMDLIAGNLGKNTWLKANEQQPVSMYINDFDKNGRPEHIITRYHEGGEYAIATKEELTSQMPYLLKRYLKHSDFQFEQITDIFTPDQLKEGLRLEVEVTASMVFWNEGGTFKRSVLCKEAQFSPVYSILARDLNKDGKQNIILGGNLYKTKPQVGMYGANHGLVLSATDEKEFHVVKSGITGMFVRGQIRDLAVLNHQDLNYLVVGLNNDSLQIFEY